MNLIGDYKDKQTYIDPLKVQLVTEKTRKIENSFIIAVRCCYKLTKLEEYRPWWLSGLEHGSNSSRCSLEAPGLNPRSG